MMKRRMMNRSLFLGFLLLGSLSLGAVPESADFDFQPVAKDVYAVIAKPGIIANGAFIVDRDDVIVVDTQLRPSWAREVIAEIRKITNKPVRYVINTHWHRDHVHGSQAYVQAFGPGVIIIQQEFTREDQVKNQPEEIKTRGAEELARMEKSLADGKDDKGAPLNAQTRASLQHSLEMQRAYVAEGRQIHLTPATVTFDHSLVLHEPNREVDLLYLGYAHTRGDLFVYLPAEKIIMTGDTLETGVIPIMRSAYPVEWIGVLESVEKLDWNTNIPGHGDVQHGKAALVQFKSYLTDVVARVKQSVQKGVTEDQAVKSIDLSKYSGTTDFTDRNAATIRRAYEEVSGKIPKP
jgi:cyclase